MKVLHSTLSLTRSGGGVSEVVRELTSRLLNESELDVKAVAPVVSQTAELSELWSCQTEVYETKGPVSFGYSGKLAQIYRGFTPDIAHIHGIWMYYSIANSRYCKKNNVPYVVSPHGMLDRWALRNSPWKKSIARAVFEDRHLSRSTCLHALCDAEADEIRGLGFTNPICVIPNGVTPLDTDASHSSPWSGVFDSSRPVMVFLGRLHPKKGLSEFLDAWNQCRTIAKAGNWALAIVGWDQMGYTDALRQKVRDYKLENDVAFLGARFGSEKDAVLLHASGFVLPSFSEGLPMAVLEAWGAGLPVLMTPECNIPAGFDTKAAMRLSSDPSLMVDGLSNFLSLSRDGRKSMGARGQELVLSRYNWASVSEKFHRTYRWMLGDIERPEFIV